MLQGLLALLGRSLRIDSRSWPAHLARLGLVLTIYISLTYALATSTLYGAPGLRFFRASLWLNTIFATLLGIGFFSTAISEEKEEDTLGLMQMAGIIPLGILLGKVGGRLCQALLLLLVQYPFTLLAVTLGGVTANQIQCSFVGLVCYVLMLAGLGLLCSTIASTNRSAAAMMILVLLMYVAFPYAAAKTYEWQVDSGQLSPSSLWAQSLLQFSSTCLLFQIPMITASSFSESPWSIQAISNAIAGSVCFLAAWAFFTACTTNPSSEPISRGLLPRQVKRLRWLSPGRPRINPFVWKDYYFIGGGHIMLLVRIVFYLGLLEISSLLAEIWWGTTSGRQTYLEPPTIGVYLSLLLLIVPIEAAILTARSLREEFRGQTLAALVMLPGSVVRTTYWKLAGAMLAAVPGAACLIAASVGTLSGRTATEEFFREPRGAFLLIHLILIPHLAMVLAMHLRWGSVLMAIGVSIGWLVGTISIFEATRIGPGDNVVWFATTLVTIICFGCHFWVISRLPLAAARC